MRKVSELAFRLQRRLQEDLMAAFQYLMGPYMKKGYKFFNRVCYDRTRGNYFKVKDSWLRLNIRDMGFKMRMVNHWKLPRKAIDASSQG